MVQEEEEVLDENIEEEQIAIVNEYEEDNF